jgi:uncharacterized protein (TIGR03083 family)
MSSPSVDVTAMLPIERDALVELLGRLGDREWQQPTECPAWTVAGLALHVLGDDLSLLARQRDSATNSLAIFAEEHPGLGFRDLLDGFNEQWVTACRFFSPTLIVEMLRITGTWTAAFYGAADLEALGEPVGLFNEHRVSPYWQIIGREYIERWVHHHQIRRALGELDLGSEFLLPACEVIVRAIAASMPALGVPVDNAVVFDLSPMATWTVLRSADGWTVHDNGHDSAAAHLQLRPDRATAVFSRGVERADVPAAFQCSGDPDVLSAITTWIAPVLGRP